MSKAQTGLMQLYSEHKGLRRNRSQRTLALLLSYFGAPSTVEPRLGCYFRRNTSLRPAMATSCCLAVALLCCCLKINSFAVGLELTGSVVYNSSLGTAVFTCAVNSSLPTTVYFNDIILGNHDDQNATGVFTYFNATSIVPTSQCRATSENSTAEVNFTLSAASASISGPAVVIVGSRFNLTCKSSPDTLPVPLIQWFHGAESLKTDIGLASVLHIASANTTQGYTCRVDNGFNSKQDIHSVLVQVPPTANIKSTNSTLVEFGSASLTCISSGTGPLRFSWSRVNSSWLITAQNKTTTNSSTLVFTSVNRADAGIYRCAVTSDELVDRTQRAATAEAVLSVLVLPRVSFSNSSLVGVLNSVLKLSCLVTDAIPAVARDNITWARWNMSQEQSLPHAGLDRITVSPDGLTLTIRAVEHSDQAIYRCSASNIAGQMSARVTVAVEGPPSIGSFLGLSVNQSGSIRLVCQVMASPVATVTFSRQLLSSSQLEAISSDTARVAIDQNSADRVTLTIEGAQHSDTGNYVCNASNVYGSTHATASVFVNVLGDITLSPAGEERTVDIGKRATFTCSSSGYPTPTMTWLLDDVPLIPSQNIVINNSLPAPDQGVIQKLSSVLTFLTAQRSDGGQVSCLAKNDAGERQQSTQFVVNEPPERPDTLTVAFNGSLWTFSWAVPFSGNLPINYVWQVENISSQVVATGTVTTTFFHINVTHLRPFTEHNFSVRAMNRLGSSPAVFKVQRTPETAPSSPPVKIITVASSTSIMVKWSPPVEPNGNLTQYEIDYCRHDGACMTQTVSGEVKVLVLSQLAAFTTYRVFVRARTRSGFGPFSRAVTEVTLEDTPSPPINITVQAISSSSLRVTWTAPLQPNGNITKYHVRWRAMHTRNFFFCHLGGEASSVAADQRRYDIAQLCAYTPYHIAMQAVNGAVFGESNFSNPKVATTRQAAAHPPQNVSLSVVNSSVLSVVWAAPLHPNGIISSYEVSYTRKTTSCVAPQVKVQGGRESLSVDGNATMTAVLIGLHANSHYEVHVLAKTDKNRINGVRSDIRAACTLTGPPEDLSPPLELTENSRQAEDPPLKTSSTLLFHISRPSLASGPISFLQVLALELNGTVIPSSHPHQLYPDPLNDVTVFAQGRSNPVGIPWIAAEFDLDKFPTRGLFNLGNGKVIGHYNGPLKQATPYAIFVRVFAASQSQRTRRAVQPMQKRSYGSFSSSAFSAPRVTSASSDSGGLSGAALALVIFAVIITVSLIVIIVLVVVYWKQLNNRHTSSSDKYVSRNTTHLSPVRVEQAEVRGTGVNIRQRLQKITAGREEGTSTWSPPCPLEVEEFAAHVNLLHANDNYHFSQEYEHISRESPRPSFDVCTNPENKSKNRYANILCYDLSRVKLSQIGDDINTTYINANYLDGYAEKNKYIATQGPVPDALGDFWRMVWEQNTHTIVMLTNLEERGRLKCHQYWPSEGVGPVQYGLITVRQVYRCVRADYVVRTFNLEMAVSRQTRQVKQMHFRSWPDHGVPEHPSALLNFLRHVRRTNPRNAGPMVIHCSAGVGRTGTFVVVDAQLQQIESSGTVDIFNYVMHIRGQRNFMVQTEAQYTFVHDAILEATTFPDTEVATCDIRRYLQELQVQDPDGVTRLEKEFNALGTEKHHSAMFKSALENVNRRKNRSDKILPFDTNRVKLRVAPGSDGSDYINASLISGYEQPAAYIVTQGPLPSTKNDFWRMVWEQKVHTIVMLTQLEERNIESSVLYWPGKYPETFGFMLLSMEEFEEYSDYTVREFLVTNTKEGTARTIRHYQYTSWPKNGVPGTKAATSHLIEMLGKIEKSQQQSGNGPIIIHCSMGAGRSGAFCALSICLERIKTDSTLDLFQTVKALRAQRVNMLQNKVQYKFVYDAIVSYLESFETYDNFVQY